ncbi:MAG: pantetheine-phosphate adenylyltransferase [Candidatus Lokiarchaeota archaeon]|nr:pantetheine-phosphate adenylyltransferase [Candidatus Lokiarchaeota archaeon]
MGKHTAGLGGTFDHLHAGHERLLQVAFDFGAKVVIGLASDKLLANKKFKEFLQTFEQRKQGLIAFAEKIGRANDLTIIELDDPIGPAITSPDIDVHVSSEETAPVAQHINEERRKRGLQPLIMVTIPMVLKADGVRYSSTEIRERSGGASK